MSPWFWLFQNFIQWNHTLYVAFPHWLLSLSTMILTFLSVFSGLDSSFLLVVSNTPPPAGCAGSPLATEGQLGSFRV